MNIVNMLMGIDSWTIQKEVARKIGLRETVMLMEIISAINIDSDTLGCYISRDEMEQKTSLSEDEQIKIENKLSRLVLIAFTEKGRETRLHVNGVHPENFYTVNFESTDRLLEEG